MPDHPHVMTLAAWADGRNWSLELQHSRPHHALIWQTRGQTRAVIDGIRRGIGAHNALVIPAGTMFSYELSRQTFGTVCLVPAGERLLLPDAPTLLSIQDVRQQAELTAIFEAMQREQNTQRPFADEVLFAQGDLLTVWLRRAMIQFPEKTMRATATRRLVQAYAALVERDFRTGAPMAEYAQKLGVTPTHLSRCCKQASGLTASELLIQRIQHAARTLLERGDMPVTHIAAELGFNSAAYFSRFVQHHAGATPTALRKAARA